MQYIPYGAEWSLTDTQQGKKWPSYLLDLTFMRINEVYALDVQDAQLA